MTGRPAEVHNSDASGQEAYMLARGTKGTFILNDLFCFENSREVMKKHYQQLVKPEDTITNTRTLNWFTFCILEENQILTPRPWWSLSLSTPLTWPVRLFKACDHFLLQLLLCKRGLSAQAL